MSASPIPDAWPMLLTEQQLCAYLGGMDQRTLRNICPVPAVDLGANLRRYPRAQVDAWVATLPPRLLKAQADINTAVAAANNDAMASNDRRESAVEMARRRAEEASKKCRTRA